MMSGILVVLLVLALSYTEAFHIPCTKWMRSSSLQASKIDITARDMDLTAPLQEKVEAKIGKVLDKVGGQNVLSTSVVLRVHKFPNTEAHTSTTKKDSQIAEVTVAMKGGASLHVSERSDDMYSSIDLLSHTIGESLKKHNEKIVSKARKSKIAGADDAGAELEEVLMEDQE